MSGVDPNLYTVIVRFEVPPENQQTFAHELVDTVEATMATAAGFRSATFFASDDGTTVMNFAQWESSGHYEQAMASDTAASSGIPELVERHGAHEAHLDSFGVVRAISR